MRAFAHDTGADGVAFGGVADRFDDSDVSVTGRFKAFRGGLGAAATAPGRTRRPETAGAVVRTAFDAIGG